MVLPMLSAPVLVATPHALAMSDSGRAPSAPLMTAEAAIGELSSGRPVTLRHRAGFSLIAPARLASAPLVDALEVTAGSPIALVLGRGALSRGDGGASAGTGDAAARAAAVQDAMLRGRRPGASAGLAVLEADRRTRDGSAGPAALDLIEAAGFDDGAIVAAVVDERREAARAGELGVGIVCVSEVARYVVGIQSSVERVVSTALPTPYGEFTVVGYQAPLQDMEFLAAVRGDCEGALDVAVSVHNGCLLGEALRGAACECRERWLAAWEHIGGQPRGIVVRLEPDPAAMVEHEDTPDPCRAALAVQVIKDLGPVSVRLIDTDEAVASALIEHGCPVVS